ARYVGCFEDSPRRRTLRGASFLDYKRMTVFRCQDNCAERGYLYAGLEFGAECYCGHRIQAGNVSEAECAMACKGERSDTCGGANRLSIYRLELAQEAARRYGSAVFRGCFRRPDNVSVALPAARTMLNMSVDKCVDFCTEKVSSNSHIFPHTIFGAGFGAQCFPRIRSSLSFFSLALQSCNLHKPQLEQAARSRQERACEDPRARAASPAALGPCAHARALLFPPFLLPGFKGERDHWRSGRTICVKTHESGQREIESFDAAILLIRNPYKALMAEFNRKYGGHIGFAAHAHWQGKEWPEFVRTYAPWWAAHTLDWLRFGRNVLVVHFEDLKRDLFAQLQRMVGLLGVAAREDRLLCVEGQKDGNFKRSGLRKLEYDPYTPEMRALIGGYIKTVDAALRLRNLSGVPDDYSPR
ncbi:WSCD2 protein, partial [Eudromia elegans]|nr:WSCD2 protein [Eudromia elegans]